MIFPISFFFVCVLVYFRTRRNFKNDYNQSRKLENWIKDCANCRRIQQRKKASRSLQKWRTHQKNSLPLDSKLTSSQSMWSLNCIILYCSYSIIFFLRHFLDLLFTDKMVIFYIIFLEINEVRIFVEMVFKLDWTVDDIAYNVDAISIDGDFWLQRMTQVKATPQS